MFWYEEEWIRLDSEVLFHCDMFCSINVKREYNIQYSSQVTLPTGTRKYHNGTPCEAPMLRCHTLDLRVTAWITTSHTSIFTRQQGPHEDQPAPRPAEHSSLHLIVASHLCTIFIRLPRPRGTSYHIFQLPQPAILKSAWTSAWTNWVPTGLTVWYIAWFSYPHYLSMTKQKEDGWRRLPRA